MTDWRIEPLTSPAQLDAVLADGAGHRRGGAGNVGVGFDGPRHVHHLRIIRDRMVNDAPQGASLTELSMGMSNDSASADEEGATLVRVGSVLFG